MSIAGLRATLEAHRGSRFLVATTLLESVCAAFLMTRVAFGPISVSPQPSLWFLGFGIWLVLYLGISLWCLFGLSRKASKRASSPSRLWASTLPFLLLFLFANLLLVGSNLSSWLSQYISTIQPFPTLAMAIGLLLVWLLKLLILSPLSPRDRASLRVWKLSADTAIPVALLLLGVLQASVYLFPIGNAFLRFWAIADALGSGIPYPVTLTEPNSIAAGSPPYVYDLPLFPLMLKAAFSILGHNSTAGHLPAAIANALFPLSLYLLIGRATGSRMIAVLFSALASLFPYFRFWVLNLPDPDPLLLTSACFAAYLYLRALDAPRSSATWIIAGIAGGILSLARPEGILYAGFLTIGMLLSRPRLRQFGLYLLCLGLFLVPMVAVWWVNFGFLWPQNYNHTLGLEYPAQNYAILYKTDALGFYRRGFDLDPQWVLLLFALFLASVLFGTLVMLVKDRRLLAFAIPGIGNTVTIFFANPYIPNTFHFADFFRHDSFGIPFLVATSAYGFHLVWRYLVSRPRLKPIGYLCLLLLIAAVIREGDKLANPTATHRTGTNQVLTIDTHLSMEAIFEHPLTLPTMTYYQDGNVTVAKPTSIEWPDDALAFFKPLDMAFDSRARPFGYASVVAVILALAFALLADGVSPQAGRATEHWPQDEGVNAGPTRD